MKIALLDQDNRRAIIAQVPQYLQDANVDSDTIAQAVMEGLGLSPETEYMIGKFDARVDNATVNENGAMMHTLEELRQDLKADALAFIADSKE